MRCELCDSETPPLYQQHSLAAWICHTCKSLGRFIIEHKTTVPSPPAKDAEVDEVVPSAPEIPSTEEPTSPTQEPIASAQEPMMSPVQLLASEAHVTTAKKKASKP